VRFTTLYSLYDVSDLMYLVRSSVVRSLHNVVVVDIISCALAFCILTADINASLAKTPVYYAIYIAKQ
jgi:hypothetical protein